MYIRFFCAHGWKKCVTHVPLYCKKKEILGLIKAASCQWKMYIMNSVIMLHSHMLRYFANLLNKE